MQILVRNAGPSHVKQLIKSRVNTTRKLYVWLKQSQIFPEVIVSGSAIGYYGIDAQENGQRCALNKVRHSLFYVSALPRVGTRSVSRSSAKY